MGEGLSVVLIPVLLGTRVLALSLATTRVNRPARFEGWAQVFTSSPFILSKESVHGDFRIDCRECHSFRSRMADLMGLYGPFSDHVPTMHMGLRFDPPRIRDNCSHDLFDTVGGELWGGDCLRTNAYDCRSYRLVRRLQNLALSDLS